MMQDHLHGSFRVEGKLASEHLVHDHAQRVEIGAAINFAGLFTARLFGRDVRRRPHHKAGLGGREIFAFADLEGAFLHFGDAEIEHLDKIFLSADLGEQHVIGFDVAMDDAQRMRCLQRFRYLTRDAQSAVSAQRALCFEDFSQAFALNVFHDDEGPSVFGEIEVIHPDRVGMLELSGDNGFALEALEEILVGQTLIDHFDGANLVEGQMPGPINRGHAAGADFFQDAIFLGNDEPFHDLGAGAQGRVIARTHVEVGGISGTASVAILHQRAP